jgi:hypothetical protein
MGGKFITRKKARIKFQLPEFSLTKTIAWTAHVDESTDYDLAQYDMIIGNDLMSEIGLDICFSTNEIKWGEDSIPMKNRGVITERRALKMLYHMLVQSPSIMEAEERHRQILDADYSKVDIQEYVNNIKHLNEDDKQKLKEVLNKHPKLFQGGLGTLKIKPVKLEIKRGQNHTMPNPFLFPKPMKLPLAKSVKDSKKLVFGTEIVMQNGLLLLSSNQRKLAMSES